MNEKTFEYLLRLADDRLILGHRLSELCAHAPILEEDIALANIGLDCIGQAKFLYEVAAELEGKNRTPDDIVYFREAIAYKNLLLVEQPNGDFAQTIVRQFLYDSFGILLFDKLQNSSFVPLAGIAQKAVKEIRYHYRHSSQWLLRLGDGTEESHQRTQEALNNLWKFTDEIFLSDETENLLTEEGIAVRSSSLKEEWLKIVTELITKATLSIPESGVKVYKGGREGKHSEHLGHLLAEMQIVARSYPEIQW
ncbi:MAG: 1,2-phenylacetyl-CoA epoxidase subunit PaaC [Bacteroidota bacterium]|nr:1,2-phenylacetyl-CoA epoxidase subunit PaaC [Bacteroidota bacterium]